MKGISISHVALKVMTCLPQLCHENVCNLISGIYFVVVVVGNLQPGIMKVDKPGSSLSDLHQQGSSEVKAGVRESSTCWHTFYT